MVAYDGQLTKCLAGVWHSFEFSILNKFNRGFFFRPLHCETKVKENKHDVD